MKSRTICDVFLNITQPNMRYVLINKIWNDETTTNMYDSWLLQHSYVRMAMFEKLRSYCIALHSTESITKGAQHNRPTDRPTVAKEQYENKVFSFESRSPYCLSDQQRSGLIVQILVLIIEMPIIDYSGTN